MAYNTAKISLLVGIILCTSSIFAADKSTIQADTTQHINEIRTLIQQMVDVNLQFKDKFHDVLSKETLAKQTPHATVVLCSDSRVNSDILSESQTGQLFVVRNIGNQLPTAYGSVEYGVNHLHTKLLLIVGHSECGAIKAAMQDYSKESEHIRTELDTLHINPKDNLNQNLVNNVNNQVKTAMQTFAPKLANNEVVIVGMIYDMHDDFKFGNGQLILVNVNGTTDPNVLSKDPYVQGIKNLVIFGSK